MELSRRRKEGTEITFMGLLELWVFRTPKTLLNYGHWTGHTSAHLLGASRSHTAAARFSAIAHALHLKNLNCILLCRCE